MSTYASKVVAQAKAWLGTKESNETHKAIIDLYNSHKPLAVGYKVKYTDEWCATFISAVAIKTGCTDIIPTECSCPRMIELLKKKGIWVENENRTPKAGDIIFYDWQDNGKGDNKGVADHVGFVEKVSGNTITVIEGNINEAVGRRTLKVNAKYIRGYATPKYDKEVKKASKKKENTKTSKETVKTSKATTWKPKVGDKVKVTGKIYGNGDGSGGSLKKDKATMYVVNVVSKKDYKYYIGVAATKKGTRQGWGNTNSIKKA